MEAFMLALRRGVARFVAALVPYLRQALRIAALPYCFFFQVDWTACTRPRLVAAFDLVYIFAKFGYYPDNYGLCRLYDYPRSQWKYYFGSGYNPFQRYLLGRKLQPERFHILFEDKEVCQQLCQGAGLPTPKLVGVLPPEADLERFLVAAGPRIATDRVILKPVSGLGGAGVFVAERDHEGWHLWTARATSRAARDRCGSSATSCRSSCGSTRTCPPSIPTR